MKTLKIAAFAILAVAFSACGSAIESKEDAAQALQRLAFATNSASADKQNPGSGLTGDMTVTVQGKEGSATVTLSVDSTTGSLAANIVYDEFSADGVNTFDGDLATALKLHVDLENLLAGMQIDLTMKGAVVMEGEYDASLEVDVVFSMKLSDLENLDGARVEVTLDGRMSADGQEYVFENETLVVETAAP